MGILKKTKLFAKDADKHIDFNNYANILLCSDKNVIHGLGVTIVSVLENIKMPCAIHIAFKGTFPEEEEDRFKTLSGLYDVPIQFYWIDDSMLQTFNSSSFITLTAYYRILMPDVLKEYGIKKCLYLDTDILCVNDFSEWYKQPLNDNIAFVTKDATSHPLLRETRTCKEIGMKSIQYFNSGIMLINIEEYVKQNIGDRAIKLCSERHFCTMDQDVLNLLLENQVIFDDTFAYNCGMSVFDNEVPDTIYFVHFTGSKKPWKMCTTNYGSQTRSVHDKHSWRFKYYEIWRKDSQKSPWANVPYTLPNEHHEWRYLAMMYLREWKLISFIKAFGNHLLYKFQGH